MKPASDPLPIVERIWREHRTALMARSPAALAEVGRHLEGNAPDPEAALAKIEQGMALPERNLPAAIAEAFDVLAPRAGQDARRLGEALLAKSPELARWFAAALAESVGDGLVAAWRLFDHPAPVRWIWLRDLRGPALFHVEAGRVERYAPADLVGPLVERYGKTPRAVLALIADHPVTPLEVERAVGPTGRHVLDALHRLLVLRRIAGYYRSRGQAVRLLRAAL